MKLDWELNLMILALVGMMTAIGAGIYFASTLLSIALRTGEAL